MDRAGGVVHAPDTATGDLGQADARTFDLPPASCAAQLLDDLDDLRHAGRAGRMALRHQSTTRVHRDAAAERGGAFLQQLWRFAAATEAERLVVEQLGDGEGVVQLDEVEVLGTETGLLVG